jgi:hypothetical protein
MICISHTGHPKDYFKCIVAPAAKDLEDAIIGCTIRYIPDKEFVGVTRNKRFRMVPHFEKKCFAIQLHKVY